MKLFTNRILAFYSRGLYILVLLIALSSSGFAQGVAINATGNPPNASAGLDVDFPNKGLLIPRVALTGTANAAPLASHVSGMMVYNTATAGDVTPGFYYDNGVKWIPSIPAGNAAGDMLFWNGSGWVLIPTGVVGQFLQSNGSGMPVWASGGVTFPTATIVTTAASAITGLTATSGGNITNDGGLPVVSRGVCWSINQFPTISDSKTSDGSGTGVFVSNLTGLLAGTLYYVRAYAINSAVVSYGNQVSFTTLAMIPTLAATPPATLVTGTTATTGGNVTLTGGATILERGVCYSTTVSSPTTADTKNIDPSPGPGIFVSNLTGLLQNKLYYVRSYARNSVGTGYGALMTFFTYPSVTTTAATLITAGTATSGGVLTGGGGFSSIWSYGVAYSTSPGSLTPTYVVTGTYPATSPLVYVTNLVGLTSNTLYYIRAYAQGSGYTVYGAELSFTTTGATAPIVASTAAITGKTATTAISGGAITSDGGSAITLKGVCWSTTPNPVKVAGNFTSDGAGMASFVSNITGLSGSTTYHVRAYATNSVGTSYGPSDVIFTTWVQAPYTVGQVAGGGICAYVDSTGGGLIISSDIYPTSPATTFTWGCNGTHVAVGTAFGTGLANTNLIIASCGANNAAGTAKAYDGGGYVDWYLPSNGEWAVMAPVYFYFGLSGNTNYFTSSEHYTLYTYAGSYFSTGSQAYYMGAPRVGDTWTTAIRAIRSFTNVEVTTAPITNITGTTATSGGTVISNGGPAVTARGVCWSTTPGPTLTNPHTTDGSGTGAFVSNITGLTAGLTYYVRSYATTAGTIYGDQQTFVAVSQPVPVVTTQLMGNLAGALAPGNGTIEITGGIPSTFGFCWGLSVNPTVTTNLGMTTEVPPSFFVLPWPYIHALTGLTIGTTYHVRAYATNGGGTAYGTDISFTETAAFPGENVNLGLATGVVFSIDGTGLHGLMADQLPWFASDWGCTSIATGATAIAIGTGMANTTAIIASNTLNLCVSTNSQFAVDITKNDGPDWYLASKDEFDLLWANSAVDFTLNANLTAAATVPFWSSSEVNATTVWYFDATTATPVWVNTGLKTAMYNAWAIRSF